MFRVEVLGLVDTVTGDVHHSVGQGGANENADAGYEQDGFERGGFGAHRGVQKVDCVIAHADDEVEHGEDEEEDDNA